MELKELLVIFVLGFLVSLNFVSADFQKTTVSDVIIKEFNQPAHFIIQPTIPVGYYQLYTLNDVSLAPKGFFPYTGEALDVYVYSTSQLIERGYFPLAYTFKYSFKKDTGEGFDDTLSVRVVALKDAVEVGPDSVDPESEIIKIHLLNKESAEIKNVTAHFSSIFFDVDKTFDLEPLQKTEISINVNKDEIKKIKAGPYVVKASVKTDKGIEVLEGKLYLVEKQGISTQEESSGFFINEKTITKINSGNVDSPVQVVVKKNILTRLFTSFNIQPDIAERNFLSVTYTWNKILGPAEVLSIKIKTNYILPFIIIILACLIVFLFEKYMRKSVNISKSVSYVRTKGREFALRVTINIKAKKNLQNITLIDRVPGIMKVYEKFALRPSKFDLATRRLEWDLGSLKAGEERIVSYIIYSKVGVVGKFSLPEALLVYEKDGNIDEVSSNRVFFLSEQVKSND